MGSVFSQIIAGDIPGNFVWRDELCAAFMTIAPIREGHVLIVPIKEVDHWDDLEESLAMHLMSVAQKVAKAVKVAYSAKRAGLMIAGLEVPHTHLHVMPVDSMEDMEFSRAEVAAPEALSAAALKIKAELDESNR